MKPNTSHHSAPFCVQTNNLTKVFGSKLAIDDLSLSIPNQGIHAIVGSNGAGKSTLFRLLLGIETPTSGTLSVYGEDATKLSPETRAKVAYVNEEHTLPSWMRVDALIKMQKHFYPKWRDDIFQNVVGFFDVDSKQKVAGLSRGERAGLNLAMALAQQSNTLILDEPTLGLDVVAKQSFLEALLYAERASESTIIYCSHQMEEIERVAENLIILERGKLTNHSSPEDFIQRVKSVMVDTSSLSLSESQLQEQIFSKHDNILKVKPIDDSYMLTMLDSSDAQIDSLLSQHHLQIEFIQNPTLNDAVNAFLSKHHSRPSISTLTAA